MDNSIPKISDKAYQSRLAAKRLIQYIFQSGLEDGGLLPPQEQLRNEMNFSHDSLSRAMGLLVDCNMITRKPRMGTVIVNRVARVPDLWTVAMPIFSEGRANDLFIDTLLRCLQNELSLAGCRWKIYLRTRAPEDSKATIADFPGLEEDLKNGSVDGVLAPALLNESEAADLEVSCKPVCQVVSLENFSCGVGINGAPMIEQSVKMLFEKGCCHLALVSGKSLLQDGLRRTRCTFKKAVQNYSSDCKAAELLTIDDAKVTRQSGRKIAMSILDRPANRRPDGVIIMTDVQAIGFSEVCLADNYHPQVIVQTNKQVPVSFGLPTTCFEVDIPQMASIGMQMILDRLRNPLLSNEKKWVVPQLARENWEEDIEDLSVIQTPVAVKACI